MTTPSHIRITNPDPDRDKSPAKREVPNVLVRDQNLSSMLELDLSSLDQKYQYRWVYKHPMKIARAKAKGYELVPPSTQVKNAVGDSPGTAEDGTITVGDVVLMRTLKELYNHRRKQLATKTKGRLRGQTKKFKKEAQEAGRRRYHQEVEVITDKEPPGSKE